MTTKKKKGTRKINKSISTYLLELPASLHREIKAETTQKNYRRISDYIADILRERAK